MIRGALVTSFALVSLAACGPHGYARATELEERDQGPTGCSNRCTELGMEMAALVLVGPNMSGCVCQPVRTSGGSVMPTLSAAAAGDAAIEVVLAEQRAAAAAAAARRR